MSLIGTVANYGGKQPDNSTNTKQFVVGTDNYAVWIYKKLPSGLTVQTPATNKYPVFINSDLYVTGSIYNTSDRNLKENILNLSEEKIDNLCKLNSVEYSFKPDNEKRKHYGFIAQEVEEIFPNLIKKNVQGYKTINYIEFIPIIISKIKTMQNEIDNLKEKIQELSDDSK
jgi:hypothetical protein